MLCAETPTRPRRAWPPRSSTGPGHIQLDRVPLHLHQLAARRGARELPAAARALALPALPAAGMAGPDQHRPAADGAGFRALVHHTSTVQPRQHLSNGVSVTTVKPSIFRDALIG